MDRSELYNGMVYLTKRLGKEYPIDIYHYSMSDLKDYVEELERELIKKFSNL